MKWKQKAASMLLAGCLVLSAVPTTALATYVDGGAVSLAVAEDSGSPTQRETDKVSVQVGNSTKYYPTLKDAVAAVTDGTATTIKLLDDITDGEGIKVPTGKKITIDFNGHKYIVTKDLVASGTTGYFAFQLLKDSDVTLKNGTISFASGITNSNRLIQNYSNLTLTDMTIDGTNCKQQVMSFNNGTVNITGETNVITPPNGTAFDVCYGSSYPNGTQVNVDTTGTIQGDIELTPWSSSSATNDAKSYKSELDIENGNFTGEIKPDDALTSENSFKAGDKIDVSGGTFAEPVDPSYLAEDVTDELQSSNGTYSYFTEETQDELEKAKEADPDAKVNTVIEGYPTVEEIGWARDPSGDVYKGHKESDMGAQVMFVKLTNVLPKNKYLWIQVISPERKEYGIVAEGDDKSNFLYFSFLGKEHFEEWPDGVKDGIEKGLYTVNVYAISTKPLTNQKPTANDLKNVLATEVIDVTPRDEENHGYSEIADVSFKASESNNIQITFTKPIDKAGYLLEVVKPDGNTEVIAASETSTFNANEKWESKEWTPTGVGTYRVNLYSYTGTDIKDDEGNLKKPKDTMLINSDFITIVKVKFEAGDGTFPSTDKRYYTTTKEGKEIEICAQVGDSAKDLGIPTPVGKTRFMRWNPETISADTDTISAVYYTPPTSGGLVVSPDEELYTVDITSAENGSVTANQTKAAKGEPVTLTVTPNDGYTVSDVTVTGKSGTDVPLVENDDGTYSFSMPEEDVTVTAVFKEAGKGYSVTLKADENGIVTADKSADVAEGETVTLSVKANDGYEVDTVTVKDADDKDVTVTNTDGTYSFTMPASDVTVTIAFKAVEEKDTVCGDYSDVDEDEWYHDAVHYMIQNGYMTGMPDGKFEPSTTLNRAMVAQILYAKAEKPEVTAITNRFSDVKSGDWFAEAVTWAAANGVTAGYTDGTFRPYAAVSRQELAVMLYGDADQPSVTGTLNTYPDYQSVADWAVNGVTWAVQNGIISGVEQADKSVTLSPAKGAMRSEAAAMFMQYFT